MPCRGPDHQRQQGMALLVALLVFAICASVMVALQSNFDLTLRRAGNSFVAEQSWEYLLGSEELAILALQLDHDADLARDGGARDELTEIWAGPPTPYPLDEGGWMQGELEDLQGRFNLNTLGAAPQDEGIGAQYSDHQKAFIRLLQALEGVEVDQLQAEAITDAIGDWIDADDTPRLNGAESSFYVSLTPSYRPANQLMLSVSELRAVSGMTPEIYRALRPFVSALPDGASINIHTAPPTVLRALNPDGGLQPLSLDDAQELENKRAETGFADIDAFLEEAVLAGENTDSLKGLLGETSSYFLLRSRVEIADREQRLYSVLHRTGREVAVLQRRSVDLLDSLFDEALSQNRIRPLSTSGTPEIIPQ